MQLLPIGCRSRERLAPTVNLLLPLLPVEVATVHNLLVLEW